MAERTITVPIDPIDRGIDRHDTDIRNGKVTDALNVINDDGDLRRRDAYKTIYTAAPHFLPDGLTAVQAGTGPASDTLTAFTNRAGTITTSHNVLYVGCDEKFDGIDLSIVTHTSTPTNETKIKAHYYNGTAWTTFDLSSDTTRFGKFNADADKYYFTSLAKAGRLTWHRQNLANWSQNNTSTFGGVFLGSTKYWLAFQLINNAGNKVSLPANSVIIKPGVRAFELNKINGIFPVRTKKKNVLVVCSDRETKRGSEKGAMVGLATTPEEPTKILHLTENEGSGTNTQVTIPQWTESTVSMPTSHSAQGSTGVYPPGSAFTTMRRTNLSLADWYYSGTSAETEWRGGPVLSLAAAKVDNNGAGSTVNQISVALENVSANQYEHYLLRITSGTGANEERQIWKNTATDSGTGKVIFYVFDDFSTGAPASSDIQVYAPHSRIEMRESQLDYEVQTNDDDDITVQESRPWAPSVESTVDNQGVHFYLSRRLRWLIDGGKFWTAAYDKNTNALYLSNDTSPILQFDGEHLRTLYPETDTDNDWNADRYANFLFLDQESRAEAKAEGITETSFLENSPIIGSIIVPFLRRLFILGINNDPSQIRFSGENAFYVWPSLFLRTIADDSLRKLQGAAAMNNRLIFWTASSIMEFLFLGREDQFDSRILHTGAGFVSHYGVQVIKSTLVGPNTDGLYAFNGANFEPVLDDWTRVFKEGVNIKRLDRCSSVHLQTKGYYMLAVASGGSNKNDKIFIWDYTRDRFWLWDAPYGASFLAKDYDENGDERLLIGTDDGHVMTLSDSATDDGKAITSYARSVPMNIFGHKEAAYTKIQTVIGNGANNPELKFFVDKRDTPERTISLDADEGLNKLGSLVLGNTTTGTLADNRFATVNSSIQAKGKDFQVQIGGSNPWRLRRMYITARDLGAR